MESYAMYLRKSRADIEAEIHGEGETLARHEKILKELANAMKIEINKTYREIVSGESISDRPVMQELLQDVENGKWTGILVVEVERLARGDTMDQGRVAKSFKYSGTKIITPIKIYNPQDEYDEEYFEFGLFMSRREYKVINRRLQNGRLSSIREGKYVGNIPPFGYDRVKLKKDKGFTLKPNQEAEIVKMIFERYAYQGDSVPKLAEKLNQMHIKPRNSSKWSVTTIREILDNPVYIGMVRWNARKESKVYRNGKVIKTRPRNTNPIIKKGIHEPIIEEKTWDVVKEKRKQTSSPIPTNRQMKNPLARNRLLCTMRRKNAKKAMWN